MLLFCRFRNRIIDCTDLFKEVITDDGICYTFNMKNASEIFSDIEYRHGDTRERSDWNLNDGYKDEEEFEAYPHRALPNADYGFNIVMSLKTSDIDHMCKGPVQGFKVKVHSPDEFPQMSNGAFRVPLNEEILVGLNAEMSKDETKFDGACHTSDTKSLKYFREYSQINCQSECRADYVYEKCGCVKFSMIRNDRMKVCTQHDTKCISDALDLFSTVERFKSEFPCDCRPACNNLKYQADVTSAIFDFKQVFKAYNESLDKEFSQAMLSRLVVYFKDDHYTMKALYENNQGYLEILSQVGGIAALFLGASIISVVEIFYFLIRKFFG